MARKVVALVLAVSFLTLCGCTLAAKPYPNKPIELVVPFNPGGGSDVFGRFVADVIRNEDLLPQLVAVVNKPGASGQVGTNYVRDLKGSGYAMVTMVPGQITTPKLQGLESPMSLTPLALLALDEMCIIVEAGSPIKTIEDYINTAKQAPKAVSVGGSGAVEEDRLADGRIQLGNGGARGPGEWRSVSQTARVPETHVHTLTEKAQ